MPIKYCIESYGKIIEISEREFARIISVGSNCLIQGYDEFIMSTT